MYTQIKLTLLILLLPLAIFGQNGNYWSKTSAKSISKEDIIQYSSKVENPAYYNLDKASLVNFLLNAPDRFKASSSSTILSIPNPGGTMDRFEIFATQTMAKDPRQGVSTIKSYVGRNIDNKAHTLRITLTPQGFYGMTLGSSFGQTLINPHTKNTNMYIVFSSKDVINTNEFKCEVEEIEKTVEYKSGQLSQKFIDDGILRRYRLAVGTTVEYSNYHLIQAGFAAGDNTPAGRNAVQSAVVVAIDRINQIFERDLGVTLQLIANNDLLISLGDAATDGYTNNNLGALIDENRTIINTVIGDSNYDVGHVLSTQGGGLAQTPAVCSTGKARGVTGLNAPVGEYFTISILAHELGHQFGANHTQSSNVNENRPTAVEPGSGTTIMSYAGVAAPNVQNQSDAMFHYTSISEVSNRFGFATTGGCAEQITTGNNAPVITAVPNYTIPINTPFKLEATASDPNGDGLTYSWDQIDNEIVPNVPMPPESTSTAGPSFRTFLPTTSPARYFPALSTLITNSYSTTWEVLPTVSRDLNFGIVVRDNNPIGGQVSDEATTLTVTDTAGPFRVTSQSGANIIWGVGDTETITWDVANTDNVAGVNSQNMDILLSDDGGLNFDTVLVSNTLNDGSENIIVPNSISSNARIMIKATDNVFFDINEATIEITATAPSCIGAQNILVENVLSNSAVISWAASQSNPTNGYDYVLNTTGIAPSAATTPTANLVAGSTSATLTSLTPNTIYYFYIRANCGGGDVSEWSAVVSFRTTCTAIAAPLVENFDGASWVNGGAIDNCWRKTPQSPNYTWRVNSGGTPSNTGPSDDVTGGGKYLYTEASGATFSIGDETIISAPPINLSTLTMPIMKFSYHMYGSSMGSLRVEVKEVTATTFTTVFSISGQQQIASADPFIEKTINLNAYAGQIVQIRFIGVRGSGFNSDMAIDQFVIEETASPEILVSDLTYDFGSNNQGFSITKVFTINNTGTANLNLSNLTLPTGFTLVSTFGSTTVAAGSSTTFSVGLNTTTLGTKSGNLTFNSNDADEGTITIALSGNVIAPEIEVSELSHNFGDVLQGATATKTFTINNTGTANLNLSNLTIPTGFTLVSTFGSTTVAAGSSTTFSVGLNTTTLGTKTGNLTFNSNDSDEGTITIALSGEVTAIPVPEIEVSALLHNFGNVLQGATSTKLFTINNTGTADLTLSSLTIPTGFVLVNTFGSTTVAAGSSTTFSVGLNTTTLGAKSGNLTFNSNDADEGTITIALSGTVTSTTAPEIVVSELSHNFGNVLQGATATKTFTINNTGTADLTLSSLVIPTGFVLVNTFGSTTVAAGGSTTFTVRINSTTLGSKSGNITFNSNDSDEGTITIALSGVVVAPEIVVSELSHNFGNVLQGATATKTFTINNTGTADLTLSSLVIPTGFVLVNTFGSTTVAAGGSTTFTVRINSTTLGSKSGNITFNSNDSDEGTITIALSGVVVAPEIVVSELSHNFGNVLQGATATKTFTINNIGTADLTLSSLTIPTGFVLVNTFGSTTVAAGGSTTFTVRINSTTLGSKSGNITFISNDSDESTITIALSGVVVAPEIVVSELSHNFGNVLQGATATKTFTINNTGTADLTLSSLTIPTGFVLVSTFGSTTVAAGSSTTFSVGLNTTTLGTKTGNLTFNSNDSDEGTITIALNGNVVAPEIVVSELSHNFGNVLQGATATKTFTINNIGTADLTLSSLTIPTGFVLVSTFGSTTVAPSGSTTFVIRINSSTLGAKSGNITFNSNDSDESTITIALSGNVIAPEIEVSTLLHNFGSVLQGTTSTKTITINNIGTADLLLSNLVVPTGFTLVSTFGSTTVAAGGSTTFSIGLNTNTLGAKTGNLTFNSNDSDEGTITIALSGNVIAPEIEVSALLHNFGSVLQGTTSTKTITINNIGTADLIISNLVVPTGFTLVSTFGSTTVAAGSSTTFTVAMDMNTPGITNGNLTFDSNDSDEQNILIRLNGTVTFNPTLIGNLTKVYKKNRREIGISFSKQELGETLSLEVYDDVRKLIYKEEGISSSVKNYILPEDRLPKGKIYLVIMKGSSGKTIYQKFIH